MNQLAVGIDIGGTWTKIGIVDQRGRCLTQDLFRTTNYDDFIEYLKAIHTSIRQLHKKIPGESKIKGIGVGAPDVNYREGIIEYAVNLPWQRKLPFVKELQQITSLPVYLINDANAAAWGELKFGNAVGMKDFMVITLGTGLGSGIVSNGQLIQGHTGLAGELGHFIIEPDGWFTGMKIPGGLEAYVSATGLKRAIMYMLAKYPDPSRFRDISFNDLHGVEINEAAEEGDIIAIQAFEFVGRILGIALANFVCFNEPEAIFLLGGLVNSGKWLLEPTRKHFEDNLVDFYKGKVDIRLSALQEENAAIVGSSALVWV